MMTILEEKNSTKPLLFMPEPLSVLFAGRSSGERLLFGPPASLPDAVISSCALRFSSSAQVVIRALFTSSSEIDLDSGNVEGFWCELVEVTRIESNSNLEAVALTSKK